MYLMRFLMDFFLFSVKQDHSQVAYFDFQRSEVKVTIH